jgi:hypothetical protein
MPRGGLAARDGRGGAVVARACRRFSLVRGAAARGFGEHGRATDGSAQTARPPGAPRHGVNGRRRAGTPLRYSYAPQAMMAPVRITQRSVQHEPCCQVRAMAPIQASFQV